MAAPGDSSLPASDNEWRAKLSTDQFRILRESHTEEPGTGEQLIKSREEGIYTCVGCGNHLYKSVTKFNSGCGWPAFFEGVEGAIETVEDTSHGIMRIEIRCSRCQSHLGHVFKGEGFPTPTDERHCVNSICLKLVKE